MNAEFCKTNTVGESVCPRCKRATIVIVDHVKDNVYEVCADTDGRGTSCGYSRSIQLHKVGL